MKWLAAVGESPNFIAFMAHAGFAYFAIHHGLPWEAAVIAALIKEFWFDLKYEESPPQTLGDSTLDFLGYATGIVLGVLT